MNENSYEAVLVGRERELARLQQAFKGSVEGTGKLVMLLGEPGIGKTYLGEVISRHANSNGALVLWGRCGERGAPAYWPCIQVLREAISSSQGSALAAGSNLWLERVARTFPELRQQGEPAGLKDASSPLLFQSAPEISETPETARFNLFESVSGFLKHTSNRRPLLILIDDLQAADVDSLQLLNFMVRDFMRSRILLVMTCQNAWSDLPSDRAAMIASLTRAGERIELQ